MPRLGINGDSQMTRVTKAEKERRVQEAQQALIDGYGTSTLASHLSEKWGCTRRNALYYIHKADLRLQKDLKKVDKRDITARLINLLELNIQKSMRQNNYGAAIGGIRLMKDLVLDGETKAKKFKHGRSTAYYG